MSHPSMRRAQTDQPQYLPYRQSSVASTASSFSAASSMFGPSRMSTVTSTTSSAYSTGSINHKRGKSEATMSPIKDYSGNSSIENSPDHFYRNARHSLRPLPQAPNTPSPPNTKRKSSYHARAATIDRFPQTRSEDPLVAHQPPQHASSPLSSRPELQHSMTTPQQATFRAPDYEELQKSSTSHLRALSKFTREGESQEYAMTGPAPSVVGLMNRRQLKRADSTVGQSRVNKYGFERNWMDKQRQFLQAYEYLCHIGEAKEWIEDVIHKTIPPIVELEEALRNGITLAELVQVFYPEHQLKIVRDPKLKFKHRSFFPLL